jgi:flavin reductase (DIM6/NTAB) family NADH-FMN oxidoreductase RutF
MKRSLGPKTTVYPTPAFVIGTYDQEGKPNMMTAAWCGICCSQPPCIGVSLRKATQTHGSIVERKVFTVNIPSEKHVVEVDYFGIATGKKVDKLSAAGLTPIRGTLVDAPYIEEFPFILECKLIHTIELGLHTHFIGEILDIKADEVLLGDDGTIDVEKVQPIVFAPEVRKYFGLGVYLGKAFSVGKKIS